MTVEVVLFYLLGGLMVSSSLVLITARRMATAAVALGVVGTSLAGVFLLLESHAIAVIELLVGTSSFLVSMLFARTLVDVERLGFGPRDPGRVVVKTIGVLGSLGLVTLLVRVAIGASSVTSPVLGASGELRELGLQLFTLFVAPLQVLGLFLLAALVGAGLFLRRKSG